jgi:hypothetical protein
MNPESRAFSLSRIPPVLRKITLANVVARYDRETSGNVDLTVGKQVGQDLGGFFRM